MSQLALVIDDEPDIRSLIALSLERIGLTTYTAANFTDAKNLIETHNFDVCLTDMRLPDGDGIEFVRYLQANKPDIPIAVITAHGDINSAVDAMKNGAFDFVSKPVDINLLRQLVTQAISSRTSSANDSNIASSATAVTKQQGLADAYTSVSDNVDTNAPSTTDDEYLDISLESLSGRTNIKETVVSNTSTGVLIGRSPIILELRSMIERVSKINTPVCITGESGTGKELIAHLIHKKSPRASHPFIVVKCGSIPPELMGSELFGHKINSHENEHGDNSGFFKRAQGGTLYLEDVAKLTSTIQVKLLRAIQERLVCSVEGTEEVIDVRVLSSSHEDLNTAVEAGTFRSDLYYCLNVIGIKAPSLREYPTDIPFIAQHILNCIRDRNISNKITTFSPHAYELLSQYNFPGNVCELENIIERAITLSDSTLIESSDLKLPDNSTIELKLANGNSKSRNVTQEVKLIKQALANTRWNRKAAAAQLGITYRQLRYRLRQYGIDNKPAEP